MFVIEGDHSKPADSRLGDAMLNEAPSPGAPPPESWTAVGFHSGEYADHLSGGDLDDRAVMSIPEDLDSIAPGLVLAAHLSRIDVAALSGHDRVVVLRAHARMASHYQARVYGDMAAVAEHLETEFSDDLLLGHEAAAAEIRVALHLTRRTADVELDLARQLHERLPAVRDALASGDLDVRRARVLADGTAHLPTDAAQSVISRIIDRAGGLTTGQIRAALRKLSMEADPNDAKDRYTHAVADRRMVTQPSEAGTAHLFATDLPPERVTAATARINQIARHLNSANEVRTLDQLRADIFLDLLCGAEHSARPGPAAGNGDGLKGKAGTGAPVRTGVEIRVDLSTLAGLADGPGELAGYGPVIADIARQVADQQHGSRWTWSVTDPASGQPVATGTTRRRPNARQHRTVIARDPTCVFPGCRMPATGCDLDHRTQWADGGPTHETNLAPLCRHDHRIRHQTGWTHQPIGDGTHQWTTHLGHTYTTTRPP